MTKQKTITNQYFFKDDKGKVVIWQWPNAPLWGWIVFKVLSLLFSSGQLHTGFEQLSTAFLLTWAYLEITDGVNYFRRILGVIVLVTILALILRSKLYRLPTRFTI